MVFLVFSLLGRERDLQALKYLVSQNQQCCFGSQHFCFNRYKYSVRRSIHGWRRLGYWRRESAHPICLEQMLSVLISQVGLLKMISSVLKVISVIPSLNVSKVYKWFVLQRRKATLFSLMLCAEYNRMETGHISCYLHPVEQIPQTLFYSLKYTKVILRMNSFFVMVCTEILPSTLPVVRQIGQDGVR